jgi:hypothetical protein
VSTLSVRLDDLAHGADADGAVLHNCRLEGAGTSVYGREAIVDWMRARAHNLEFVQLVEGRRCAALFASDAAGPIALFADLHEERITRLWYLAAQSPSGPQAQWIDIPYDASFGLPPTNGVFNADAHLDLLPEHVGRVSKWASEPLGLEAGDGTVMHGIAGLERLRCYVLRAFSSADVAAVLAIGVAHRSDGRPGLVHVPIAARLPSEQLTEARVVVDEAERAAQVARSWRPAF